MNEVPEIPQGIEASRPTDIPEGSIWGDEDRFYIFDNGRWVDLMELTDDE